MMDLVFQATAAVAVYLAVVAPFLAIFGGNSLPGGRR
jgi:hypothetical protein